MSKGPEAFRRRHRRMLNELFSSPDAREKEADLRCMHALGAQEICSQTGAGLSKKPHAQAAEKKGNCAKSAGMVGFSCLV